LLLGFGADEFGGVRLGLDALQVAEAELEGVVLVDCVRARRCGHETLLVACGGGGFFCRLRWLLLVRCCGCGVGCVIGLFTLGQRWVIAI